MDEFVEEIVRYTAGELGAMGRKIGEVDGIPVLPHVGVHAVGTFSIKLDLESHECRRAFREGVECRCSLSVTASNDLNRKNSIWSAISASPTLRPEAFDDYDEARHWPHP